MADAPSLLYGWLVPGRGASRIGTGALAFAAIAVMTGSHVSLAPGQAVTAEPKVLAHTTPDETERVKTIPIMRRSGASNQVVASMGPRLAPDVQQDDRVEVTAEVEVTTDCDERHRRCAGRPYDYDPIVTGRLVLADGSAAADGTGVKSIARRERFRCRQRNPGRTHHCVMVFSEANFSFADAAEHGCAPGSCRLNLVLGAHNQRARGSGKDKLIIGSNRPNGEIEQDKARINAVRFRPESQPKPPPTETSARQTNRLPLTSARRVVYSQRLDDLRAGEQLVADARMRMAIEHLPYSVRVNSHLMLTEGRSDPTPGRVVKDAASRDGQLSEANGFNCVQLAAPCPIEKVGVLTMKEDVDRPLYVNLLVGNSAKQASPRGGDRARVARHGRLKVVRYPAALRG